MSLSGAIKGKWFRASNGEGRWNSCCFLKSKWKKGESFSCYHCQVLPYFFGLRSLHVQFIGRHPVLPPLQRDGKQEFRHGSVSAESESRKVCLSRFLYISVATLYKSHAVICPLLMASFSTSSVKMEIWLWFSG